MSRYTYIHPRFGRRCNRISQLEYVPISMELFAAATGCSDSKIARDFLERAGNDVTRAVNYFLDAPPPRNTRLEDIAPTTGDKLEENCRPPCGLKRPHLAERSTSRVNGSEHELLIFEQPAKRSAAEGGGSSSRGTECHLLSFSADTKVSANSIHSSSATVAITHSAEWGGIVQRCQR